LTRWSLIFSAGHFCAFEYLVRPRFAQQMLRRCSEFGDSLSPQRAKQQRELASATRQKCGKNYFHVGLQTDRDGSPCVKGILVGLP